MGFKPLTLNTPPEEEAHVLAEDDAAIFQSIFGKDGVFETGDRMKATVINNNQVRVSNGVICVGGHIGRTEYGDYSDMIIENGEISKNRNDIIMAVFSTTGKTGIDEFKIEVKKGTPGIAAEDPEIVKGDLYEGSKIREFPLWRVKLEGINIVGVEKMFNVIPTIPELEEKIELLNGKLNTLTVTGMKQILTSYGLKIAHQKVGCIHILRIAGNPNGNVTTHNITLPAEAACQNFYSAPVRVGNYWGNISIDPSNRMCSIKMDGSVPASLYFCIWCVYI